MSKQTDKSLFIVSSIPRLYQRLLAGVANQQSLGNRILAQIKAAQAFRQMEQVRELGGILANIPIKEFQLIARYYLAWCQCRESKHPDKALEQVIEQSRTFKTKALISRAALDFYKGNYSDALYFYFESFKTSPAVSDMLLAAKAIAVIKSNEGFHSSALKDMERLLPILRYAEPYVYYDFLNSYAVELAEVGRIKDAAHASSIALASPFAVAYPEWRETRDEIRMKGSRASKLKPKATIDREIKSNNVVPIEGHARTTPTAPHITGSARVFWSDKWKARMDNKQTKKKPIDDTETLDKLEVEFLRRYKRSTPSVEQYKRLIEILREGEDSKAEEK